MRKAIVLPVLCLTLAGGYYFLSTKPGTETGSLASSPQTKTVKTFAKALEREIPGYQLRATGREVSAVRVAELEAHVDAVIKEKVDPRIASRLNPASALGKRLCRLAMTVRLGDQLPDAEMKELAAAYLNGFAAAHDETIYEAHSAMGNLSGPEFAQERLGVLAVLNGLPGSAADVKSFALTELTTEAPEARPTVDEAGNNQAARNIAMSMGPAQALPVYAYKSYLDAVGNDSSEALNGTLQVLQSQPDAGLRQILASAYINQFPDSKALLYDRLSQVQINLPDIQAQPVSSAPQTYVAPGVLATQ